MSHFSYTPLFQGPHFLTKMLESKFSMIIYICTFYLFDNIEKISESLMRIILLCQRQLWQKMHMQTERLIFLFAFCARHYRWWSLWRKNTENNYFIHLKPPFLVVECSNTVIFWRNARFDIILTSVSIIKQVSLRKLLYYESPVDIEV